MDLALVIHAMKKHSEAFRSSVSQPPTGNVTIKGSYWKCHGSAAAPSQGAGGAPSPGAAGPPLQTNVTSNRRLQQTQAQVNEVVDIMRVNVDKVLERDQKLSELDNRADALQAGASQFETSAAKLKRKNWWKNCKMMIILGIVCAVILIIIISEWFNSLF
ncbi:vesicle-associated membrane protein 2-like [Zootoca vivipara]|uniref:vesicle-associated membrane protein 2-like n=1 Tax=Zootoca vivipara TaxID=8524 RepID=UPI00293C0E1E|nr:vesicle-associated membrane protein 2-like [Zootoca vivipara]